MLNVGKIVKPQGIRGEVKVMTSDPSRFCVLKTVDIDGKKYKISSARVSGDAAYVKLDGVDDRNKAEELRGKTLKVEKTEIAPLDKGEFYVADLVGARLVAIDGKTRTEMGNVARVDSFGAADVFTVEGKDKSFSFPFVKALAAEFDESEKTLRVDGKRLSEVAVYED